MSDYTPRAGARHWSRSLGGPSGARVSPLGVYRTLLWRSFDVRAAPLVFCMLNPSTADDASDDPTIRRCLGFARRENAGGIVVVNLSPWRGADPADLYRARRRGEDVLWARDNTAAWHAALSLGPLVVAWGGGIRPWLFGQARLILSITARSYCLGTTRSGEPRHPLMLPRDARMTPYDLLSGAAWAP